jgi:hypothetical protein
MHTYGCINGTIGDASTLALDGSVGSGNVCNASPVANCTVNLTTTQTNDVIVAVCAVAATGATFSTPTAPGLTFFQRGSTYSAAIRTQAIWYAIASGTFSGAIKCAWTSGAAVSAMMAFGVHGANTTTPFDTNASLPYFNANFPVTNPSCTISTSNANDFIFAALYSNGSGITGNPASPFSSIVTNVIMGGSYEVVSATQTNLSITWTTNPTLRLAWICDAIVAAGT